MIFVKNIAAFRSVRRSHGVGLIAQCYCQCVYLELCLKTDAALRIHSGHGHAVPQMLRQVPCSSRNISRQLASLVSRLENRLRSLRKHERNPINIHNLDPAKHPEIRYLCHISDAPTPTNGSTDSDLTDLLSILDQITHLLQAPNTNLPL